MKELLFDVKVTCGKDELALSKCDSRQILNLLAMLNNVEPKSPTFYTVDVPKLEIWPYKEDEDGKAS
jgi:hypothetical protein